MCVYVCMRVCVCVCVCACVRACMCVSMYAWKEGNVLFNDAINTVYLRSYDIRHILKDHLDSKGRNLLLSLHGLLFSISSKGSFICTAFVIPVREHWLQ